MLADMNISGSVIGLALIIAAAAAAVGIIAVIAELILRRKAGGVRFTSAAFQGIGSRRSQQDFYGVRGGEGYVAAAVADGIGGLDRSERVSRLAVEVLLRETELRGKNFPVGILRSALDAANEEVNKMLGGDIGRSGTTMTAVIASDRGFEWISVGDSRIYLYTNGGLYRVNTEHNRYHQLLEEVIDGRMTMEEARGATASAAVTSFVGMGDIEYIDYSVRPTVLNSGDRLLLMTDGVFGILSDEEIAEIIKKFPDVNSAAAELEERVKKSSVRYRDNFTAVIIGAD